jgi:high affinity Mn2+ porin
MKTLFFKKNTPLFLILTIFSIGVISAHAEENGPDHSDWNEHFQATSITQTHNAFHSPYSGALSVTPTYEVPTSGTATLFIGHKLWKDAYAFTNPEESMGGGIAQTHGIAAFPNGEIYRVDDPSPKTNLSRLFIEQDFGLGGEKEKLEDDINQFARSVDVERVILVAGKFSLNDYLDQNAYSHDPRTQFFNWALMDTGAWDYSADTRGYTWGIVTELHLTNWSYRVALVQVPKIANGMMLDGDLTRAHSENLEVEYRHKFSNHPGRVRLLGYMNQADMGNYRLAIDQAAANHVTPDITQTRSYSTKYGFALNIEQELTPDLGLFSRIGWNDGATETWAFTEIDRSFSVGLSLKGTRWHRADDVFGFAIIVDGLSKDHEDYLAAGGLGFIIGDGALNYAPEEIIETYYSYQLIKPLSLTLDLQGVNHPAYNADRGPLAIYGLRVHYEI